MNTLEMAEKLFNDTKKTYKAKINDREIFVKVMFDEIVFYDAVENDGYNYLRINRDIVHAEWEEVKPEPKFVTFLEAAKSGKKIKHERWINFYEPYEAIANLVDFGEPQLSRELKGNWLVEE